MKMNYF